MKNVLFKSTLAGLFLFLAVSPADAQSLVMADTITNPVPTNVVIIFKKKDGKGKTRYRSLGDPTGERLLQLRSDTTLVEGPCREKGQFWEDAKEALAFLEKVGKAILFFVLKGTQEDGDPQEESEPEEG